MIEVEILKDVIKNLDFKITGAKYTDGILFCVQRDNYEDPPYYITLSDEDDEKVIELIATNYNKIYNEIYE